MGAAHGSKANLPTSSYVYEIYRDDSSADLISVLIFFGVGTALRADDYSDLSNKIVSGLSGVAVIVVDFEPSNPTKNDAAAFASSVKFILDTLDSDKDFPLASDRAVVVGGHSAGGYAAASALTEKLYGDSSPVGFVGLDPCPTPMSKFSALPCPAFVFGFTKQTCGVDPELSAKGAYLAGPIDHRTMILLQNTGGEDKTDFNHCVFTDKGCGFVCPVVDAELGKIVRSSVAGSLRVFLGTLEGQKNASKEQYQDSIMLDDVHPAAIYVDGDEV
uniref:Chlorophyllase n=1 Tax=Corethron hystrix TaxID=216773 RepID=A0A7S1BHA6_9STRA